MKKLFKEFTAFVNKGNALALAIGVIIGGAFTGIVSAINLKIISPLIAWIIGGESLEESSKLTTVLSYTTDPETGEQVIENAIYWGAFIQAIIDFLIIAVILFLIFKIATAMKNAAVKAHERLVEQIEHLRKDNEEEPAPVEEAPVVEAPVVVEPELSKEALLLTEIRDLLSKTNNKDSE